MLVNRRSFLQNCLALAAAPAIVRADSLMRIMPRSTALIMPELVPPITTEAIYQGTYAKLLWPGVKATFASAYNFADYYKAWR
jgi:hypothetical protein